MDACLVLVLISEENKTILGFGIRGRRGRHLQVRAIRSREKVTQGFKTFGLGNFHIDHESGGAMLFSAEHPSD